MSQLAGVMNEDCIDDTITTNAYSKLADGTYFATISTPDVYSTFLDELVKQYETEGLSHEEAETKARELDSRDYDCPLKTKREKVGQKIL